MSKKTITRAWPWLKVCRIQIYRGPKRYTLQCSTCSSDAYVAKVVNSDTTSVCLFAAHVSTSVFEWFDAQTDSDYVIYLVHCNTKSQVLPKPTRNSVTGNRLFGYCLRTTQPLADVHLHLSRLQRFKPRKSNFNMLVAGPATWCMIHPKHQFDDRIWSWLFR